MKYRTGNRWKEWVTHVSQKTNVCRPDEYLRLVFESPEKSQVLINLENLSAEYIFSHNQLKVSQHSAEPNDLHLLQHTGKGFPPRIAVIRRRHGFDHEELKNVEWKRQP